MQVGKFIVTLVYFKILGTSQKKYSDKMEANTEVPRDKWRHGQWSLSIGLGEERLCF